MLKKSIAIIALLCITFSLSLNPANAAVKNGVVCQKLGKTTSSFGILFKCTKSGKKLVWKRVTENPAPTDVQKPKTPDLNPISIESLDYKGVPQHAYQNVITVLDARPRAPYIPTKFIGPNVLQIRVDQETTGINRAIDLWSPYFKPEKFQTIYVMGGDEDWLEKKSLELGLNSMLPGGSWTSRMKMQSPCGFAYAGVANEIPTFVQCLNPYFSGAYKQIGPHEYTHLFQRSYSGAMDYKLPWYSEGSASYFGWTLGFYPYDPNSADRTSLLVIYYMNMSMEAKSDFTSKDMQRFKNRMKSLVPSSDTKIANASYWAGGLATEALIALYGFNKFVELTKNIQANPDMSSLLKQTYGFDEDYFYEKLAPYVWAHLPKDGQGNYL